MKDGGVKEQTEIHQNLNLCLSVGSLVFRQEGLMLLRMWKRVYTLMHFAQTSFHTRNLYLVLLKTQHLILQDPLEAHSSFSAISRTCV